MQDMDIQATISRLRDFRQASYQMFEARPDATMDLIDALSTNISAQSVVELSLNPYFRFTYNSVYDAIDSFFIPREPEKTDEERCEVEKRHVRLIASVLPEPTNRLFWLFALDGTPYQRLWARTLADRGFIHVSEVVSGKKPVTIGHEYSPLVYLPEKTNPDDPPWVVPLSVRRVPTSSKPTLVGAEQVAALMEDEGLPFHEALCVLVADIGYSAVTFLGSAVSHENLVTVTRFRSNRVFYHRPEAQNSESGAGHPTWYGERFAFREPDTWGEPDEIITISVTTKKGRIWQVRLEGWHDKLMRGKKDIPMHQHPFTLIRVQVFNEQGKLVFRRPMWLGILGERRREISLTDAREAYTQRFDEEHYFRFDKQRMLMTAFETPDVRREENWMQIVPLAYTQLWLARELAQAMPYPWERYQPHREGQVLSPSMVQRDFGRIIREIGTPAQPPKPRGNSGGRPKGTKLERRIRHAVIRKGKKPSKIVPKPAQTSC
jgi:hypothetical protein